MTIARLCRVTLAGPLDQRLAVFADLQELGCVHLDTPRHGTGSDSPLPAKVADAVIALRYLRGVKTPRRQAPATADVDFAGIVQRVLENRRRMRAARERLDQLRHRVDALRPWGDFALAAENDLAGLALWLYRVPVQQIRALEASDLPWLEVRRDTRFGYFAVASPAHAPPQLPGMQPVPYGPERLAELEAQVTSCELLLDDLEVERVGLTRWIALLERNLANAENRARLSHAAETSYEDRGALFLISGWVAEADAPALERLARRQSVGLMIEPVGPSDEPPTLLSNQGIARTGQDLLTFYSTPAYRAWDPSPVIAMGFALFFAMIVADAGYALTLWLLLAFFHRPLGATGTGRNLRRFGHLVCAVATGYGVLTGSFWGSTEFVGIPTWLPEGSLPLLDLHDHRLMIKVSVVIGALHVALGLIMAMSCATRASERLQPLGWLLAVAGGIGSWIAGDAWSDLGWLLLGAGLLLVVVGAGTTTPRSLPGALKRLGEGLLALRKATQLFGDLMSYLRLFALGLATSALAVTFNGLADQVQASFSGVGLLLGLLVLIIGHGINLILAVVGGTVHGLRLNYIEFLQWSGASEGYAFRPFCKKEVGR